MWRRIPTARRPRRAACCSPACRRSRSSRSRAASRVSLQVLLTSAIADLESGAGTGPGAYDLVYGGDTQAWIQAAHSLKARLYLHVVEPAADKAAIYRLALAEAQQGISSPENDFRA